MWTLVDDDMRERGLGSQYCNVAGAFIAIQKKKRISRKINTEEIHNDDDDDDALIDFSALYFFFFLKN